MVALQDIDFIKVAEILRAQGKTISKTDLYAVMRRYLEQTCKGESFADVVSLMLKVINILEDIGLVQIMKSSFSGPKPKTYYRIN